jgi:hypothetical protein
MRARSVRGISGELLGFVHQKEERKGRWLVWHGCKCLDVVEEPDESLVFSLRRGWAWLGCWDLYDADDRLVGSIRGRTVQDGCGYLLAAIEEPDAGGRGRFLSAEGRVLGQYEMQSAETKIDFAPQLEGNPFARMLLLGCLLVNSPAS